MRRDPIGFRERFKAWKRGERVYDGGRPLLAYGNGKDGETVTNYPIPFIPEKAITLTNAGLATGARLSTNLLDSIADNAVRAGLDVKTAIGLATKESTLGNPTDDRSMRTLLSRKHQEELTDYLKEKYGLDYDQQFGQHINYGNTVYGQELINYHRGNVERKPEAPFTTTSPNRKSIIQKAFEYYKSDPYKYNPGQKNYPGLVDKRAKEVFNSPEIQKWHKDWTKNRAQIMRPIYNIKTDWNDVKFPKYEDGKDSNSYGEPSIQLPEFAVDGYAPIRLTTYYPGVSKYPYTGHSELRVPIDKETYLNSVPDSERDSLSDRTQPYLFIDKKSRAEDYNFITNNCADATLNFLNYAFRTNESPNMFTTPGDVEDYAINRLNGKFVNNNDGSTTILIPRNKDNYKQLSIDAINWAGNLPPHSGRIIYYGPFRQKVK